MSDTVCSQCHLPKPDIAYPVRNGRRNGRVCKACRNIRLATGVRPGTTRRVQRAANLSFWRCPECDRGHPDVFPHSGTGNIDRGAAVLCRGCHNRQR